MKNFCKDTKNNLNMQIFRYFYVKNNEIYAESLYLPVFEDSLLEEQKIKKYIYTMYIYSIR